MPYSIDLPWLFDQNPQSLGPKKARKNRSDPPQRSPPTTPPAAVRPVPGHPGAAGRRCRPGGGLCRWDGKFLGSWIDNDRYLYIYIYIYIRNRSDDIRSKNILDIIR